MGRPRATARDDAPVSCPPLSTLTHNAARSGTVTGGDGCENPKCAPTVEPRQLLMQRRTAARLTCHRKISATDAQSATPCACARWGCVGGHIGCRGSPPRRAWLTTAAAAAGRCARVARRRRRRTGAAGGEAVPNESHRVRGRRSRGVPRACGGPTRHGWWRHGPRHVLPYAARTAAASQGCPAWLPSQLPPLPSRLPVLIDAPAAGASVPVASAAVAVAAWVRGGPLNPLLRTPAISQTGRGTSPTRHEGSHLRHCGPLGQSPQRSAVQGARADAREGDSADTREGDSTNARGGPPGRSAIRRHRPAAAAADDRGGRHGAPRRTRRAVGGGRAGRRGRPPADGRPLARGARPPRPRRGPPAGGPRSRTVRTGGAAPPATPPRRKRASARPRVGRRRPTRRQAPPKPGARRRGD